MGQDQLEPDDEEPEGGRQRGLAQQRQRLGRPARWAANAATPASIATVNHSARNAEFATSRPSSRPTSEDHERPGGCPAARRCCSAARGGAGGARCGRCPRSARRSRPRTRARASRSPRPGRSRRPRARRSRPRHSSRPARRSRRARRRASRPGPCCAGTPHTGDALVHVPPPSPSDNVPIVSYEGQPADGRSSRRPGLEPAAHPVPARRRVGVDTGHRAACQVRGDAAEQALERGRGALGLGVDGARPRLLPARRERSDQPGGASWSGVRAAGPRRSTAARSSAYPSSARSRRRRAAAAISSSDAPSPGKVAASR